MTLFMAFLGLVGEKAAFSLLFGSFDILSFFKLFLCFRMLFLLFSYFSISFESLATNGAICRTLLCSFPFLFFSKRISLTCRKEHANLTFSRSFYFSYIGGKETLGSRHSTFSHNIYRSRRGIRRTIGSIVIYNLIVSSKKCLD